MLFCETMCYNSERQSNGRKLILIACICGNKWREILALMIKSLSDKIFKSLVLEIMRLFLGKKDFLWTLKLFKSKVAIIY